MYLLRLSVLTLISLGLTSTYSAPSLAEDGDINNQKAAEETVENKKRFFKNGFVFLGLGIFDVRDDEDAADFRLEYRSNKELTLGIKPMLGLELSSDKAIHLMGGLYRDFDLTDKIFTTLSLAGGIYDDGDGKYLGYPIQFRSMAEIGYKFNEHNRISTGFSHTSNAGLDNDNPGTEALIFYYQRSWP